RLLRLVLLVIGEPAHTLVLRVGDLDRDLIFVCRLGLQVVIQNCALGRVVAHWPLAVHLVRDMQAYGRGRLTKVEVSGCDCGVRLSQGADVVEYPERPAT